ncbi:MAG: transglycosylase domain-containing protein [Candidatus Pacebacteria bacterium]|nr:transglycosylase domain-containing protein [Candidatus Paceibacterota bacterium]
MRTLKKAWRSFKRLLGKTPEWLRLTGVAILALILFGMGGIVIWASLVPIPTISDFQNRRVSQSTQIFDRTGNVLLYDVHGEEERTSVPLNQISPYIQHATIAIEDQTFYSNPGIDPTSIIRALLADFTHGYYAQGASTITQQVVRNALLTTNKTLTRKVEEVILALRLTHSYSKDDILSAYLNETPYGGPIYGVEAASQYFFGVDAGQVDLAQAAYLAALPQAPTYYSPYGGNRAALDARKDVVLQKMLEQGYITKDEYDQAVAEKVQFKQESTSGIKAPNFVFYVEAYLEQKYGADAVQNGGLKVITTLDYDLQQYAENVVASTSAQRQADFNDSNTAVVAVDPKTGQILSMVGSEDYFNDTINGQVNDALALRQPGSSFKPFVYATAFEAGYTPDTVVFDLPTQFSLKCSPQDNTNNTSPCYSPSNYDGQFHGPLSLRDAIAISDNVASVKVLYLAGIPQSISTAESLGITTLTDPQNYGLSLVLGGGDVTLLQETAAYGGFANDGTFNPPTGILEVTDSSGNVLEQYTPQPQQALEPQIARLVNDILSDDNARAPEFTAHGVLWFNGYDVADKTGTTDDSRDAWVIGYDPNIVVGEWAGNNDNSPMVKKIAAFIVAPTWHQIMSYALSKYSSSNDQFPPPAPEAANLPPVLQGNWNTDPTQGVHDILYWVQKSDPLAGRPTAQDPQQPYWDYPVQIWAAQNGQLASSSAADYGNPIPGGTSQQPIAHFVITSPQAGATVPFGTPVTLQAQDLTQPVADVVYYVNGSEVGQSAIPPYAFTIVPTYHGPVQLRAVGQLLGGTVEEAEETFIVQ